MSFPGPSRKLNARVRNFSPARILPTPGVITSYSIHYTKLYDCSDRAFGGADTLATSKVLAAAIEKLAQAEELGLVFCGKQTIDGDTAQVGPGIASRLGLHQLTLVDRIEHLDLEKKTIRVRRKLEGVITSYSIHYTKLYEGRRSRRSASRWRWA